MGWRSSLSVNTGWCLDGNQPAALGCLLLHRQQPTTAIAAAHRLLKPPTQANSPSARHEHNTACPHRGAPRPDRTALHLHLARRTSFHHHMNPSEEAPTAIRGNFIPVDIHAVSPSRQRADVGVHIHLNLTDSQMDRLASSYVTWTSDSCLHSSTCHDKLTACPQPSRP